MTKHHTFLATIKGAVPECFAFVTIHSNWSGIKRISFVGTERTLRAFWHANGRPGLTTAEIDSYIETARKEHQI